MLSKPLLKSLFIALPLAFSCIASADPISPHYTTFGTLSGATFGGSGIPNDSVAITQIQDGGRSITLGLTAHQRYSNPVVTDDNAGTFFATPGGDTFSGGNSNADYARWNLGFYVDFNSNITLFNSNPYTVSLYFDKDPSIGNSVSSSYNMNGALLAMSPVLSYDGQNSWNLGMTNYFGSGFDPDAIGEYSFALVLSKGGTELGRSAINVIVGDPTPASVPDAGSTVALLGAALCALGLVARVRRR